MAEGTLAIAAQEQLVCVGHSNSGKGRDYSGAKTKVWPVATVATSQFSQADADHVVAERFTNFPG